MQASETHELGSVSDEAAEVDHALHALAARGRAHELEVARWLVRAEAIEVHRRFGFGSLAEYVERRLGLSRRELREKLRVARALTTLPLTAEALRRGEQSWSAVRELTRVATPETEAEWLTYGRGRTVRQLERRVARHRPGDTPRTPRHEAHLSRRLVFEVAPEELSKVRAALDVISRGLVGSAAAPGGLLVAMAEVVLGQRDVTAPAYQTVLTVCAGCSRTWQRAGAELVEVSDAVAGCARCDGEVVGLGELSAEDDALADVVEGERSTGNAQGPEPSMTHVGRSGQRDCVCERGADDDSTAPAHRCGAACAARGHGDAGARAAHVGHAGHPRPDATSGSAPHVGHGEPHPDAASCSAAHVGHGEPHPDATSPSAPHVGHGDPHPIATSGSAPHVGDESVALAYLRQLATDGGARPILRLFTRALGVPLRSVTPNLRRLVFARDQGRCIVPGCPHWRFIDVHHVVHRGRGGPNRLDNLACLCTAHHRAVHDGVLAIEGSATEGWVFRHAGGGEYGRSWAPTSAVAEEGTRRIVRDLDDSSNGAATRHRNRERRSDGTSGTDAACVET